MTVEARVAFLILFFALWCSLGMLAWCCAAVWVRGRHALLAFPLALAGAAALGILVPLAGARDATGLLLSLPAAFSGGALGSWGGIVLSRHIDAASATPRPEVPPPAGVSEAPSDTLET